MSVTVKFWDVDDSRAKDWLTKDGKTCPFIGQIGGGLLSMHEDMKLYPPICIGRGLTYLPCGDPKDQYMGAIDVHPGQLVQ